MNNDTGINDEGQDYRIGIVYGGVLVGEGRVKGEDEVIWLMNFIYEINQNIETTCSCSKWGWGKTVG
jgi:hypothetical protein